MLGETGEIGGGGLRGRGEDGREVVHTGSAPPAVPVVNTETRNLGPSYYRLVFRESYVVDQDTSRHGI